MEFLIVHFYFGGSCSSFRMRGGDGERRRKRASRRPRSLCFFLRAERKDKGGGGGRRQKRRARFFFSRSLSLPRSRSPSSLSSFLFISPASPQKPERRHEGSCFSTVCLARTCSASPPTILAQLAREIRGECTAPVASEKRKKKRGGSRRRRRPGGRRTQDRSHLLYSPLSSLFSPFLTTK